MTHEEVLKAKDFSSSDIDRFNNFVVDNEFYEGLTPGKCLSEGVKALMNGGGEENYEENQDKEDGHDRFGVTETPKFESERRKLGQGFSDNFKIDNRTDVSETGQKGLETVNPDLESGLGQD
jgi:hypothetical protein